MFFTVVFLKALFVNLFEVVEIIRAFGFHAFMYDEVLPAFFWNGGIAAMGTARFHGSGAAFRWGESSRADLSQGLLNRCFCRGRVLG